jgi:hypothetical protein
VLVLSIIQAKSNVGFNFRVKKLTGSGGLLGYGSQSCQTY